MCVIKYSGPFLNWTSDELRKLNRRDTKRLKIVENSVRGCIKKKISDRLNSKNLSEYQKSVEAPLVEQVYFRMFV